MDSFDNFLTDNIKKDKLELDLDNSVFNHLHYMVNLNSTKSIISKNSMFGFLSDFLSPRFILAKVAIVSILLILFIGNYQNKRHDSLFFQADSTLIQNNSYDTLNESRNQISDSLYF